LALGGNTAVLERMFFILQWANAARGFHQPKIIITAEMFSEPTYQRRTQAEVSEEEVTFDDTVHFSLKQRFASPYSR